MDSSVEIVLRAYLLKIGLARDKVEAIPTIHGLLTECESKALELDKQSKTMVYEIHDRETKFIVTGAFCSPRKLIWRLGVRLSNLL
jgi:hypothetical protein